MMRSIIKRTTQLYAAFLMVSALVLSLISPSAFASVCAVVKIEIQQELALERQGFDAKMLINNGLTNLSIDNLNVNVAFTDENGQPVEASSDPSSTTAKFFIKVSSMTGVSDITGNGTIAPSSSAEIHWLIIPAPGAASNIPSGKLYFIGADMTYNVGGEPQTINVSPDSIYVKPLPILTLDYFLPKDVYADDAFTPQVEPPIPFTLGVRVRNNGSGTANNVAIQSAQPKIVENKQGLLIGFTIIDSFVNEVPRTNSLLINFGDIQSNQSVVGRWDMETTLSGQFIDFTASYTHSDDLGGQLTSLINPPNTYTLVHDVLVDLPGRDNIRDFLAYPNGSTGDIVTAYESDNVDSPVANQSANASLTYLTGSTESQYKLAFTPTIGLAYVHLADPTGGLKVIKQVIRSDGKFLPLPANAWLSKTRNLNNDPPTWEYWINFFDSNTTGQYTVILGPPDIGPTPPILTAINNVTTYETNPTSFPISATDPNGDLVTLTASGLPAGASFNATNGSGIFSWTPAVGQAGIYSITYTATDPGGLSSSQTMSIRVNTLNDTDGDGMDDNWEKQHFGDLSHDGTADSDGDGYTDLQEYLNGTDPNVASGPDAPVIVSPLFGTDVNSLTPTLTWQDSVPPSDKMTYDVEIYSDTAMSNLVTSGTGVTQTPTNTSFTVATALTDNTTYYWRVRANTGKMYSLWSAGQFFVNYNNNPPGPFSINSPLDGAQVNSYHPTLEVTNSVDPDNDPVTYGFEIYSDAALTTLVTASTEIPAGTNGVTDYVVGTALTENTTYYWRAIATDSHGAQTMTISASFLVSTINDPPSLPTIVAPADASVVTTNNVTLTVGDAVDPEGSAVTYNFQIDTVSSFDSPALQSFSGVAEIVGQTSQVVTGLVENTTYYWRVQASDGQAQSAWVTASFKVNAVNSLPPMPSMENPGDKSWVATLTPTVSVNSVTDPDGDSVSYHFQLFDDASMSNLLAEYTSTTPQWVMTAPLTNETWYFWRVRAEDSQGGASAWTTVISFFVDDNGVNDPPSLTFLAPTTPVTVDTGYTLHWDDNDPDSNASISLYYSTTNAATGGTLLVDKLPEDPDGAADTYAWDTTAIPNGTYYVYAVISDEVSTISVLAPAAITVAHLAPLPAITDMTGRAKYNIYNLLWTPVDGAEYYNIYRSSTSGGPYTLLTSHFVTSTGVYRGDDLIFTAPYYYVVTSVRGGIESAYSNEVSLIGLTRTR